MTVTSCSSMPGTGASARGSRASWRRSSGGGSRRWPASITVNESIAQRLHGRYGGPDGGRSSGTRRRDAARPSRDPTTCGSRGASRPARRSSCITAGSSAIAGSRSSRRRCSSQRWWRRTWSARVRAAPGVTQAVAAEPAFRRAHPRPAGGRPPASSSSWVASADVSHAESATHAERTVLDAEQAVREHRGRDAGRQQRLPGAAADRHRRSGRSARCRMRSDTPGAGRYGAREVIYVATRRDGRSPRALSACRPRALQLGDLSRLDSSTSTTGSGEARSTR